MVYYYMTFYNNQFIVLPRRPWGACARSTRRRRPHRRRLRTARASDGSYLSICLPVCLPMSVTISIAISISI